MAAYWVEQLELRWADCLVDQMAEPRAARRAA